MQSTIIAYDELRQCGNESKHDAEIDLEKFWSARIIVR
jgi:hypothetical protein